MDGAEYLGTSGEDSGMVGLQLKVLRDVFQGISAGGYFICVRDVGVNPLHGTGPGKLPSQSHQVDNEETAKDMEGWGIVVTTAGYRNRGGGF